MGSVTGYGFWEREIYVLAFRLQGESLVCEVGLDALQGLLNVLQDFLIFLCVIGDTIICKHSKIICKHYLKLPINYVEMIFCNCGNL